MSCALRPQTAGVVWRTMQSVPRRVLTCPNCGGPLQATDTGGWVTCSYCNVSSVFGVRPSLRSGGLVLPDPNHPDERARVARLHALGRTFDTHKDRFSLDFAPKGYEDVDGFDVSRETATRLERDFRAAIADPDALPQRTTWWIAERLTNLWRMRKDHPRARAVAQTGSEVLTDPRFKQTMFTALAGDARRERDLEACETWLAQCDPTSEELTLDNDFRNGVAHLALARGDGRLALRVVGVVATTYAWSPQNGPMAALIRAAAHEDAGNGETADEELRSLVDTIAESTIRSNGHLDPDTIREECRDNARMWIANTLDRAADLSRALSVWHRLAEAGELPAHGATVARFRKKFGS